MEQTSDLVYFWKERFYVLYFLNLGMRCMYVMQICWHLLMSTDPQLASTSNSYILIVTCIHNEIFCYMMNRLINRGVMQQLRRRLIQKIIFKIEDDLKDIEYTTCRDLKDHRGVFQYIPCPRIRKQAMKFNLPALYSELGKEFMDGDKRLERAVSASGMTLDLESQNVEFRQPSDRHQFRRNAGFYDCKCGTLGSLHPCEYFRPAVFSQYGAHLRYVPEQEKAHFECSKARIDEEISKIHDYHRSLIRRRRFEPIEKGVLLEEASYMI